MAVARMLGEEETEFGEFDGISVFADESESEIGQVAVGAPGTVASLKKIVRAVWSAMCQR